MKHKHHVKGFTNLWNCLLLVVSVKTRFSYTFTYDRMSDVCFSIANINRYWAIILFHFYFISVDNTNIAFPKIFLWSWSYSKLFSCYIFSSAKQFFTPQERALNLLAIRLNTTYSVKRRFWSSCPMWFLVTFKTLVVSVIRRESYFNLGILWFGRERFPKKFIIAYCSLKIICKTIVMYLPQEVLKEKWKWKTMIILVLIVKHTQSMRTVDFRVLIS